jgi:Tfp pilus assembly pilus retraction ATPase PilT
MVSIVRENPDIVFLGEIRDRIAAEVAILLASTGHMVLATFHSAPITAVFERYKSMISPDNVPLFASSIELVVTQYLQNYSGIFFPVFEIVERSPAIQTLITENRLQELYNYKGNGVVLTREESIKRQELIIKSEIIKRKASEFEKFITR